MVSLVSANAAQLKVVYQEKSFGLCVHVSGFLNEINKMSRERERKRSRENLSGSNRSMTTPASCATTRSQTVISSGPRLCTTSPGLRFEVFARQAPAHLLQVLTHG